MMTRWMFFLLLGLNLAIFFWPQSSRSPGEPALSGTNPIPSLKLTSELVIPMVKPVKQGDGPPHHPQREPDLAATSIPNPIAEVDSRRHEEQSSAAETASPQAITPPKEVVDQPPAPATLEVSHVEAPSSATARVQEAEPPLTPPQAVAEIVPPLCLSLGPFSNRPSLGDLGKELGDLGGKIAIRQVSNKVETGYWVIIPPRPSLAAANEMVEKLRADGISDVMRFPKGELANAISVGVFSAKTQAEQHRKNMAAKGFQVEILPRFADKPQFWIDALLSGGRQAQNDWRRTLTHRFPSKGLSALSCEENLSQ